MKKIPLIKPGLITLLVLFSAILSFRVFGCESIFLFYPDKRITHTPADIGLTFEDITIVAEKGIYINGWWVPSEKGRGTVLFCHGNAGNISHRLDSIALFHRIGLNVLIFDYRGYGKSSGEPSEKGTYRDAEAVWTYCTGSRGVKSEDIIVFGRSLGGAIAAWIAGKEKPGALILESTFTSAADVASHHYRFLPAGMLFGNTYATEDFLAGVKCPVLVIHSPDDEIIPYRLGKRLFDMAPDPKEFISIKGSHNSGFIESMRKYEPAVREFIYRTVMK